MDPIEASPLQGDRQQEKRLRIAEPLLYNLMDSIGFYKPSRMTCKKATPAHWPR